MVAALASHCYRPATLTELLALTSSHGENFGMTIAYGSIASDGCITSWVPYVRFYSNTQSLSVMDEDIGGKLGPSKLDREPIWIAAVRDFGSTTS